MNALQKAIDEARQTDWWQNHTNRYIMSEGKIYDTVKRCDVDPFRRLNQQNDFLIKVFREQANLIFELSKAWAALHHLSPDQYNDGSEAIENSFKLWQQYTEEYQNI